MKSSRLYCQILQIGSEIANMGSKLRILSVMPGLGRISWLVSVMVMVNSLLEEDSIILIQSNLLAVVEAMEAHVGTITKALGKNEIESHNKC